MATKEEELYKEIELKKTLFRTENYPMSIGELYNLYKNKEIIITPAFQRLFRWTEGQKVKLIESIILGIPIPTIFVFQNKEGLWELVDGLQRVSTILQFMGILEGKNKLVLSKTKYLPSLENFVWEKQDEEENELPDVMKLNFKRSKLNFTIILSESDPNAKFEVFQRLNTGGSNASNQEVRNSIMIMIRPEVFEWFTVLATNEDFIGTISITERLVEEQYHIELVLRLITLLEFDYDTKKDLGDNLDEVNELILTTPNFPLDLIKDKFIRTFKLLNTVLGDKAFRKFDGGSFKGKFLESSYEAIATGIIANIDQWDINNDQILLQERIQSLYQQDIFSENVGSGSNARTRIPRILPFAKEYFSK